MSNQYILQNGKTVSGNNSGALLWESIAELMPTEINALKDWLKANNEIPSDIGPYVWSVQAFLEQQPLKEMKRDEFSPIP